MQIEMWTTVLTNALTKSILAGNSPATALLLIIPNTNPNKAITTASCTESHFTIITDCIFDHEFY